MNPAQGEKLGGVALYNPHLLSKAELTEDFVARRVDLARLVDDLRARIGATPQHHLVLGQRGMGKSTLLRRVAYAVEDEPALAKAYLPLVLPEEQYNVKHLTDLWLNCLDAMSDTLEAHGHADEASVLDDLIARLPRGGDDAAELQARGALLSQAARRGQRLLLLVDNLDLVVDRIRAQDWRLREVLQESDALVIVGASASALESTWEYGRAFYDFFRVHRLNGLTDEETQEVLVTMARKRRNARVEDIALHHPERIRPVRLFAGGNPRTIAVLYEVLAAGPDNDLRAVLETLLDRYTPLYKARFEALAVQAQQVVDALCQHWDPATAATLATASGIDVSKVSVQLDRLVTDGVVEKVQHRDRQTGRARKKAAYQISERLFNTWYLMRTGRRARRILGALMRCIEALEGPDGLSSWASAFGKRAWVGDATKNSEIALAILETMQTIQSPAKAVLIRRLAREVAARPDLVADLGIAEGEYTAERDAAARMAALIKRVPELQARLEAEFGSPESALNPSMVMEFVRSGTVPLSWKEARIAKLFEDNFTTRFPAILSITILSLVETRAQIDSPWLAELRPLVESGCDWSSADFSDAAQGHLGIDEPTAQRRQLWLIRLSCASVLIERAELIRRLSVVGPIQPDLTDFDQPRLPAFRDLEAPSAVWLAEAWIGLLNDGSSEAKQRMQKVASATDDDFTRWLPMLDTLTILPVAAGLAAEARDLIDAVGLTDRWRPMREALHARALGSPDVLEAVAPEVRDPARRLYDSWLNIQSPAAPK